jgi:hypothetical protein
MTAEYLTKLMLTLLQTVSRIVEVIGTQMVRVLTRKRRKRFGNKI